MRKISESKSKVLNCIIGCLFEGHFTLMLEWINEKEGIFSIKYVHRSSPKWKDLYLGLFKKIDSLSESKFEKYKTSPSYENDCKTRFKSNLKKLCEAGDLTFLKEHKEEKSIRLLTYQINNFKEQWRPHFMKNEKKMDILTEEEMVKENTKVTMLTKDMTSNNLLDVDPLKNVSLSVDDLGTQLLREALTKSGEYFEEKMEVEVTATSDIVGVYSEGSQNVGQAMEFPGGVTNSSDIVGVYSEGKGVNHSTKFLKEVTDVAGGYFDRNADTNLAMKSMRGVRNSLDIRGDASEENKGIGQGMDFLRKPITLADLVGGYFKRYTSEAGDQEMFSRNMLSNSAKTVSILDGNLQPNFIGNVNGNMQTNPVFYPQSAAVNMDDSPYLSNSVVPVVDNDISPWEPIPCDQDIIFPCSFEQLTTLENLQVFTSDEYELNSYWTSPMPFKVEESYNMNNPATFMKSPEDPMLSSVVNSNASNDNSFGKEFEFLDSKG